MPSYVAGFRTWKALGRSVSKGQRGYAILAPVAARRRLAKDSEGSTRELGPGEKAGKDEQLLRGPRLLRGFTVAHVWDMSQTTGAPAPEPPTPILLRGGAPAGLYDQLVDFLHRRGFTATSVEHAAPLGGANGLTDFHSRTVHVRTDMDDAARVKTLAHETGHVLLHDPALDAGAVESALLHRGRAEVEAESVAYVVTSACGMDPSAYSLPYVASWAGTSAPADLVRDTARRVIGAAQQVLHSIRLDSSTGDKPRGLAQALERAAPPPSLDLVAVSPEPQALGR
jgi:hypothetical protein